MPNYGEPGRGPRLAEGMVLAIEPMVNVGKPAVKVLADGWTAVTRDGSLSAHFEHTVAVTRDGPQVLTLPRRCGRRRSRVSGTMRRATGGDGGRAASRDGARDAAAARCTGCELDGRHQVTAHLGERVGRNFVRMLVGDRVPVGLSPRRSRRAAGSSEKV